MRLIESYPKLILRIRDDGCGFDPGHDAHCPKTGRTGAWDWSTCASEAWLLGGSLRIVSSPGHGTTVVAEIPYAGDLTHDDQTPAHC